MLRRDWLACATERSCYWAWRRIRRSELVALDIADIAETETGLLVTIRRSKTDQEGEGVTIAIARGDVACPAKAFRE